MYDDWYCGGCGANVWSFPCGCPSLDAVWKPKDAALCDAQLPEGRDSVGVELRERKKRVGLVGREFYRWPGQPVLDI